jgi:hypothetical protein
MACQEVIVSVLFLHLFTSGADKRSSVPHLFISRVEFDRQRALCSLRDSICDCLSLPPVLSMGPNYEEVSANMTQMDIKRKICDIRIWKKNSTDTLVPSLYQRVETRSTEVFWLISQPLPHLRSTSSPSSERLSRFSTRFKRQTAFHRKQETFLYEYHLR